MDDGSTDGSGEVCDRYAAEHGNIRAFHQKNQGLALSRRNGLRHARGNYVFFLDSDDWIKKESLGLMHGAAASYGAAFVAAQYRKVDGNGRILLDATLKKDVVCRTRDEAAFHEFRTRYINTSACAKLIRKKLLDAVTFPQGLAIGEEHDMVAQLVSASDTVVILKEALYCYFQRTGSISRSGYNGKYRNSLFNYMRLSDAASAEFPRLGKAVRALYLEFEMGVITAMCRNGNYDWDVVRVLRDTVRSDLAALLSNQGTRPVFKLSALLILLSPRLFVLLYSAYYCLLRFLSK